MRNEAWRALELDDLEETSPDVTAEPGPCPTAWPMRRRWMSSTSSPATDECATSWIWRGPYIDMGDQEGARDILSRYWMKGNDSAEADAREKDGAT